MSTRAAAAFFDAARSGDRALAQRALAQLAPALEVALRGTLARQSSLLRRARVEPADVMQRVFERMLTSPPTNPNGLDPDAVLVTWARTVAVRFLVDLARRAPREVSASDESPPSSQSRRAVGAYARAEGASAASQEQFVDAGQRWMLACACAESELARHKYLRELFYALAEDPEASARELALRIGLLAAEADDDAARRAEQYVWKLRERVHTRLADALSRAEKGKP